ncbi:glycosyltransferase family 2 protein [Spirosoma agri]|uniref:Glycosyltransferase family 2 protein n=1 Tax=Spirosoma agri TaxID=1987381 RepID=A0A6M0IF36_9BACT|nr:glycosyltransferase family 2 protein [Spirosoma agri]NEU66758.1 glycosyltransferase family 2 protein [Spirosoma agri]
MKRVSVCMATYNGALFIEEQIHSILNQLGLNDELIISDDGSTDDTIGLINSFQDQRLRLVPSRRYRSTARNFENALQHAQGEYVFLSDQDDVWYPDKVETILASLASHDLVLTDCRVVDSSGGVMHESFFKNRRSQLGFWRNLWKNSYMGCCMAFRRDVLSYVLPFPHHIYYHDWWIGLMVELRGKPFLYGQPLILYRRHGSNMTPTGESSHNWKIRIQHRFWLSWSIVKRTIALRNAIL